MSVQYLFALIKKVLIILENYFATFAVRKVKLYRG